MRVCPNTVKCPTCGTEIKCGYQDISGWRQNRWRTDVDFMHWIEFQAIYPNLARDLELKKVSIDTFYAYRLSGKKHRVVERILLSIYKIAGKNAWHIPREHFNHTRDLNQKRLVDLPQK